MAQLRQQSLRHLFHVEFQYPPTRASICCRVWEGGSWRGVPFDPANVATPTAAWFPILRNTGIGSDEPGGTDAIRSQDAGFVIADRTLSPVYGLSYRNGDVLAFVTIKSWSIVGGCIGRSMA